MFYPTQPGASRWFLHTMRPTTMCAAQPSKKCWMAQNWTEAHSLPTTGVQCYCLNNWILHWWKLLFFCWTTLAQDAPDITGADYEYYFAWSYALETGYYMVAQWEDTTQVCRNHVYDGDSWVRASCFAKYKNRAPFGLYFGIQYFYGFQ